MPRSLRRGFCSVTTRAIWLAAILLIARPNVLAIAADDAVPRAIVALTFSEPTEREYRHNQKLLVRELVRQAVSIAARDELGLATRDSVFRETTQIGDDQPLEIMVYEEKLEAVRIRISRGEGEQRELILDESIKLPPPKDGYYDYYSLVQKAEEASRTIFVEALKKAGFGGSPLKQDKSVQPTAETLARLNEINLWSQFAAVRELHELERTVGSSPHTLAALVRTYSILGQITHFHPNGTHKAFKARALLYAQRLMRLDERSRWALAHRAFAQTMAGMHAPAIVDLETLARLPAAENQDDPDETIIGSLVTAADAYCHYDRSRLEKLPPDARELSALISYLIVENCYCTMLQLGQARTSLEVIPECYMISDSMARVKGVSNQHVATTNGPATFANTWEQRVKELPGVPAAVVQVAEQGAKRDSALGLDPVFQDGERRVALFKGLIEAGKADRQDPSWESLGRMLEDLTFVHAARRLEFFATGLGVPSEQMAEQLKAALALVADHPYRPLVECSVLSTTRDKKKIEELIRQVKFVDAEMTIYPVYTRYGYIGSGDDSLGLMLWYGIAKHMDHTAQDLERVGKFYGNNDYARSLRRMSPFSPQAVALVLDLDPKASDKTIERFKRDYGQHAGVQRALAGRQLRKENFEDYERCMRKYLEMSPDQSAFQELAKYYRSHDQRDKWRTTLEEALEHEDTALSHAQNRVAIARDYMEHKDFEKALPYAMAAAETGAGWAMTCASECLESLGRWDQSEQLVQFLAQRYTNSRMDWYLWCIRNDRGDKAAAKAVADAHAKYLRSRDSQRDHFTLAYYNLLTAPDQALPAFRKALAVQTNPLEVPFRALYVVLLADAAGDTVTRDEALARFDAELTPDVAAMVEKLPSHRLGKWLQAEYARPMSDEADLAAVDKLFESLEPDDQADLGYFVGLYLKQRGDQIGAQKYLARALDSEARSRWTYTLASILNRELGAAGQGEAGPGKATK